jgi:replication factor A1
LAKLRGSNVLLVPDLTIIFRGVNKVIGQSIEVSKECLIENNSLVNVFNKAISIINDCRSRKVKRVNNVVRRSRSLLITTISKLSIYMTNWAIHVHITNISTLREFFNGLINNTSLQLELIDREGSQISATLYNEAMVKYKPILIEGKCYQISNGVIKVANKKFSTIKCDVCIILNDNSSIIEIPENATIPKQILELERGEMVDIIGIVVMFHL